MQKITKQMLKTLNTVYLYPNGCAAAVHEGRTKDNVWYQFVDVWEQFVPDDCKLNFTGRIIFGRTYEFSPGPVSLCQSAHTIRAERPSLNNGSQATQEKCMQVGYLEIKSVMFSVHLREIPGVLCSDYTYQPNSRDDGEEVLRKLQDGTLHSWGDVGVRKIYRQDG